MPHHTTAAANAAKRFAEQLTLCQFEPLPLPKLTPNAVKSWLDALNAAIDTRICTQKQAACDDIKSLIALRSAAIDLLLVRLYEQVGFADHLALFAVGGYGRGELLPFSDVDILLIGQDVAAQTAAIERFVAQLWDFGITPAVAVRSLEETKSAVAEQTIATAMLEARLLAGDDGLADFPYQAVKAAWTTPQFFIAKMQETHARYLSHHATEYNLEPNIKAAPGGLRDIHMIGWLGKFQFNATGGQQLVEAGFITADELENLIAAERFLWCLRHHLHTIAGRGEERLLFDHQKSIAVRFGFATGSENHSELTAALERMMRQYYRHAMRVAAMSEMLCAWFDEHFVAQVAPIEKIDDTFAIVRCASNIHSDTDSDTRQIAAIDTQIFSQNPAKLLEIFLIMGNLGIKKIAASTTRAIFAASSLIDDDYRNHPEHRRLFLANLKQNNYLFHRLRLMKRYGVLGAYLPAFGAITGLMQYDLFHRYTVDAHTLLLLRILHRFGDDARAADFGLVSEVYQKIARKDLLVIAAIFHDIAKGRGGDHSELGAVDAYEFCQSHGLDDADSRFVAWLVSEHLTMSLTAQKQDISDPDVVHRFASFTGSIARLNYLYVLTVADMNATNSQLWNSWRASLLKQLYVSTHRALSAGTLHLDKDTVIANRKSKALEKIATDDTATVAAAQALWANFEEEYFAKQKHEDIAWQTLEILKHQHALTAGKPIIAWRAHTDVSLGGISLLICTPNQDKLFATTVCVLDKLGLSVLDANILTTQIDSTAVAIDSYVLIDTTEQALLDTPERLAFATDQLAAALAAGECQIAPRRFDFDGKLRHFTVPTTVHFSTANSIAYEGCHQMQLVTKDRPALLARIGQVFNRERIGVHGARITTLGERAEDIFYINDADGNTLDANALSELKAAIIAALDER